jgi:N-acetyl-gamma-glutamyl-phosphate reductase/acetylglutamate kinase
MAPDPHGMQGSLEMVLLDDVTRPANKRLDVYLLDGEHHDKLLKRPWVAFGTKLRPLESKRTIYHLPRPSFGAVITASSLSRGFPPNRTPRPSSAWSQLSKHDTPDAVNVDHVWRIILKQPRHRCGLYTRWRRKPTHLVAHSPVRTPIMTMLLPSRYAGLLNDMVNSMQKDHYRMFWTVPADDENRA